MNPDLHDFSPEEYALRQKKAKELMEEKQLDALLVTDPSNYRLLSGMRSMTKNRPTMLVLPKDKEPTLIVNTFLESAARNNTWIKNLKTYRLPFTIDVIQFCLKEMGLSETKIGAELDAGSFPSFIASRLQQEMSSAKFVDASQILSELRMVKTDAEVQCMRRVCEITGKAYERLFEIAKEGVTEREAAATLFSLFMKYGADIPINGFLLMNSGGEYVGVPTDKPLRKGDFLWFDSGCSYKGYHSDFGRVGVVGIPSQGQRETWNSVSKIVEKCLSTIRPGIKLNEIHRAGVKACVELGLDPTLVSGVLANRRPHIGHSVGLEAVEPPMIDSRNETIVKPNMILAIEPTIVKPNAVYHLEQMIVVTEDGYEMLSKVSAELFEIE